MPNSVCLSLCLPIDSVCLSLCLPVTLSACRSVCLSLCVSVFLNLPSALTPSAASITIIFLEKSESVVPAADIIKGRISQIVYLEPFEEHADFLRHVRQVPPSSCMSFCPF